MSIINKFMNEAVSIAIQQHAMPGPVFCYSILNMILEGRSWGRGERLGGGKAAGGVGKCSV